MRLPEYMVILSLNIRATSESLFLNPVTTCTIFQVSLFYTSSLELSTFGFCSSHFSESEATAQCGFDLYQNNNDFENFS